MWHLVSEDPERTIEEVLDHIVYQTNSYAEWQDNTSTSVFKCLTKDELRSAGVTWVMTAEESIAFLKANTAMVPIESGAMMVPPGYPPEKLAKHAQLFADKVLPAFT